MGRSVTAAVASGAGDHYCEGAAQLQPGPGFFRPDSRPSRDLGVLLLADLAAAAPGRPLQVLDAMAGCGIRALRYGLEVLAGRPAGDQLWVNDADPDRQPLLRRNLQPLQISGLALTLQAETAQQLLARALLDRRRFDLLDLDAFGCPAALLPLALEAVRVGGLLYLASTDGRSPTGHDRPAALRQLGAAARAHPASWELALRLQIGVVARTAWAQGRGVEPLLSFSEGRTFRTALRLRQRPKPQELAQLGLLAHCHQCGDQQVQSLLQLRQWQPCLCVASAPLAISGPLWIGPLQHGATLARLQQHAGALDTGPQLAAAGQRLLARLLADPGDLPRCWPTSSIGRCLGGGPPPLAPLATALQQAGYRASASGVMPSQLRSDAPWAQILATSRQLARGGLGGTAK
ncbi:MAG: N2,N2-dimethylguanosine tRNA methyltransferase [Cyanobacteriota bacterium]|nr:N2,N2-dimethylguanosine tRNA methyltransferase [Cyanobacteriota bacterium]